MFTILGIVTVILGIFMVSSDKEFLPFFGIWIIVIGIVLIGYGSLDVLKFLK